MARLDIRLDRHGEAPIYRQLFDQIMAQVDAGELAFGSRLPASRTLARELGVSRISVVKAYGELRTAGYLRAHAGRGSFIAGGQPAATGGASNPLPATNRSGAELREMMRLARKPGVINFSHGSPPKEFFPVRRMQEAINHVIDRDGADALSYEVPAGLPAFAGGCARLCAGDRHRLPSRRSLDHRRRPASHRPGAAVLDARRRDAADRRPDLSRHHGYRPGPASPHPWGAGR